MTQNQVSLLLAIFTFSLFLTVAKPHSHVLIDTYNRLRNSQIVFLLSLRFSIFSSIIVNALVFFPLFLRKEAGPFFAGTDGETLQIDNVNSHFFSNPLFGITNNALQGLGGNQQWIYNFKLDPGYQLLYRLGDQGFAASHWFWSSSLSVSILLLSHLLGLKKWLSLPTGLTIPFIFLSSNSFSLSLVFFLSPHNLYSMAIVNILIYLLISSSQTQHYYLHKLFGANLLFLYFVTLNPPYIVFAFPILLISLFSHLYLRRKNSLPLFQITFAICLQIILCGPFLAGIFLDSAAFVFSTNLMPLELYPKHATVLLNFDRKPSIFLYLIGIVSCINQILDWRRSHSRQTGDIIRAVLATLTLVLVIFNLFYAFLWWNNESLRKGLRPVYFEFFTWTFVLIFLFMLLGTMIDKMVHFFANSWLKIIPLLLVIMFCFNTSLITASNYERRVLPPPKIRYLQIDDYLKQIDYTNNSKFKGRLLLIYGDLEEEESTRKVLYEELGSDFLRTMSWSKRIPTLNEFGHHISPPSFVANQAAFVDKSRPIPRNQLIYNSYDPKLARLFGVRFILTTKPLAENNLRLELDLATSSKNLYLYEIPFRNSGILTPVSPQFIKQNQEVFTVIKESQFDPTNNFIVNRSDFDSSIILNRSIELQMSLIPGGYNISAKSRGNSIVVLPIEFSNCFKATQPNVKLIRVNGVFLGILFFQNLKSNLIFHHSIFTNTSCKLQNFIDSKHTN